MAFKLRSGNGPLPFKQMGSSPVKQGLPPEVKTKQQIHQEEQEQILGGIKEPAPTKHGKNPAGDKPHKKFKTETEHEEYHDIHPTKVIKAARDLTKVDPDAPGTPGEPGYEPEVKSMDYLTKTPVGPRAEKKKSPAKHPLPGNEEHVHDSSFDVDTSEDEFTKEDKKTYVTNKEKKVKKVKVKKEEVSKGKKKKKKGTVVSRSVKKLGKFISGIRIKGGGRGGPKAW